MRRPDSPLSHVGGTQLGRMKSQGALQWFSRYASQNSKVLLPGCLVVARGWGPERDEDINGYAFGLPIHL